MTAEKRVWMCLIIAIIGTNYAVRFQVDLKNSGVALSGKAIEMTILSTLLTPGIIGGTRKTKASMLLGLWAFCCVIIVTYCTGSFTSEIIKPTGFFVNVKQLAANNYKIVFHDNLRFAAFRRLVQISKFLKYFQILHFF